MLHHVVEYARQSVTDSEVGFARRDILWCIRLDSSGSLVNIEPLQDRKAKQRRQWSCPDMPNMRAAGEAKRAHFLVDPAASALAYARSAEAMHKESEDSKTLRRHRFFVQLIAEAATKAPSLDPIVGLLQDRAKLQAARMAASAQGVGDNDWLKFMVGP